MQIGVSKEQFRFNTRMDQPLEIREFRCVRCGRDFDELPFYAPADWIAAPNDGAAGVVESHLRFSLRHTIARKQQISPKPPKTAISLDSAQFCFREKSRAYSAARIAGEKIFHSCASPLGVVAGSGS